MKIFALAAAVLAIAAAGTLPAGAEFRPLTPSGGSGSSDQSLSFRNGVVYDDDLVPGEAPNATYLGATGDQNNDGGVYAPSGGRQNSRQLIGPDGRVSGGSR